ncbi:LysE family translocator [Spartinivicinus poritis]|uniref:LysE family translocator n=1 Tax=Spartinivicinus poritis TaxID=2994640 RepID=A0ABT5U6R3_9GAMM|nr:LysE family translocator [Spartinivicinus sp. A2-2]MDE1462055.1 LysE family translocator [Spartinivicinus sp. A2-2]
MISIEFIITSLVVVLIPGTGVLYTVATGLFMGARASIYAAIGCTLGIVPSLLASVMGLAVIFHTSALAFQAIKYAGVAYLLFLAWSMWRSSAPLTLESEHHEKQGAFSVALKGFLINILNPKLTIFFLAFLPQFLPQQIEQPMLNMVALGSVFMIMTFVVFIIYGLLANSIRHYIIHSEKVNMLIQKGFAGSFAALGLKLAFTENT